MYPNPSSKFITVDLKMKMVYQPVEISLLDVLGRLVSVPLEEEAIKNGKQLQNGIEKHWSMDVSQLQKGVYYIRIATVNCIKTIQIQVLTNN